MPVDSNPEIKQGNSPNPEDHPSGRPRRTKNLMLALIVVLVAAGAYRLLVGPFGGAELPLTANVPAVIRSEGRITVPEGSPVRTGVSIARVEEQEVQRSLVLPATVEADPARLIKVLPHLAGRVTQLKVELGEQVEAGQPLVVIDSPDLAAAYADYDRAKVQLSLTLKNRDRLRSLNPLGGAALKDVQQSETDYATAEAEFRRSETRLNQIGVDAETTNKSRTVTVTAPLAGSVIDLAAAPGAYWNDPTVVLMTLADLSTIWVTAGVPEKDTSLVAKGQPVVVTFAAYPGEVFKGQVLFVSDVLDADTRRTKVRVAFANPGTRLKPGMFADVSFQAPARGAAVVPASALLVKDNANQVFVEVAPWVFEARNVDIDFQKGEQVVLSSGINVGDRIVVKGGVLLGD
jgi:membrane fusion protein, heavy metal efflux system